MSKPSHNVPQVLQLVALQELQEDPFEFETSPLLVWLKVERSFVTFFPEQRGQATS